MSLRFLDADEPPPLGGPDLTTPMPVAGLRRGTYAIELRISRPYYDSDGAGSPR